MNTGQDQVLNTEVYAFPASPLQERLWKLNADGADPAWNVAVRFKLVGALSLPRFQKALDAVIAGNEILRTSFALVGGDVQQLVAAALKIPVQLIDSSNSPDFDADLLRASREQAEEPTPMEHAPLLRVALVRRDQQTHYLLVTAHHAIMDGASIGLFSDALLAAYDRLGTAHMPQPEAEPALQFADYTLWLKEQRETPAYRAHADYWLQHLEGAPAILPPSGDSGASSTRAEIESLLLPRALTDAAQRLCQDLDATFSQLALAVFACATNKLDTVIGIPVASRSEVQLETMIGPFVNYLPLRISADASGSFAHLLDAVAEASREALAHSEFRYEDILQAKGLSQQSLFSTMFICQRDFVQARKTQDLELTAIPSVSPGALHELTVFLVERSDGWRLSCETDGRVTAAVRRTLLDRYQTLLQSVCNDPRISLQSLVGNSSQAEKVITNDAGPTSFPLSATQERYWALSQIDPTSSHLNLHIRYAVEGALDLTAFGKALHLLAARHDVLRTSFHQDSGDIRQRISPRIELPLRHHDATKEPLDLAAITTLFDQEKQRAFDLEQGPLWSVLTITSGGRSFFALTLSHIISDGWSCGILMRELLVAYEAIFTGAAPHLDVIPHSFGETALQSAHLLHDLDQRLAFWDDVLSQPLPALHLPTDASRATPAPAVTGTRNIDPMLAATISQVARDYGVTVANVYAAAYRALLLKYTGEANLLIAMPIANRAPGTEAVVGPFADSLLLRSSIGATFESALLATQDSLLSAIEHTVPLQFLMERRRHSQSEPGSSVSVGFMYQEAFVRDLAGDHLVLQAMENHLTDFSFDWHMAVIDRGTEVKVEFTATDTTMSQDLAALILEDFELSLSGYVLAPRKQLVKVPGTTQRIKQLCEAAEAQGKNVKPVPSSALQSKTPIASPEKTAEMVQIWQQVFGRSQITGSDNFFALGGHSLLLARLQVALEKAFGYRIFAADIFAAPTCEQLAYRMNSSQRGVTSEALTRIIPIQPEGKDTPLFVISQSMIIRELAERLGHNQPTFTIQFTPEDVERLGLSASMQQIAALYIEHLRTVRPSGPYRLGGWCISGWVAYEMAHQLRAAGEEVELLLILDAWAPNFWRDMTGIRRVLGRASYYAHRIYYEGGMLFTGDAGDASLWTRSASLRQGIQRVAGNLLRSLVGGQQPEAAPESLLDQMMNAAAAVYHPALYDDPRTLVFRSAEQPRGGTLPDHMGWAHYLSPEVSVLAVPGDHTSMFSGSGATIMAECIRRKLGGRTMLKSSSSSIKESPADLLNIPLCL